MISKALRYASAAAVTSVAVLLYVQFAVGVPADARKSFARPTDQSLSDVDATDAVWTLGQKLFFDPQLSSSASLSCASCHQPDHGWSNGQAKAIGEAHRPLAFRAPTLLNVAMIERYGWTGRFADVEEVSFFAMSSAKNMNLSVPKMLARLHGNADYAASFSAAFPGGAMSKHRVGVALDKFVRSITSDVAPFDRWVTGDDDAISASAARGFSLFTGKAKCSECHSGWTLTDGSFHDIGIGRGDDIGRGSLFRSSPKLQYAFKTPTLRDVAVRGPYMHDGSLTTLLDVVDHYDKGGIDRPSRATAIRPLGLAKQEKQDLVAFLKTLTGGSRFAVTNASD